MEETCMPETASLVTAMAEILDLPAPWVARHQRALTATGYGHRANGPTPQDATDLLIAVAAAAYPDTAAEAAKAYGTLPASARTGPEGPGHWLLGDLTGLERLRTLPEGHTLEQSLLALVDACGTGGLSPDDDGFYLVTPAQGAKIGITVRITSPRPCAHIECEYTFDGRQRCERVFYSRGGPEPLLAAEFPDDILNDRAERRRSAGDACIDLWSQREFTGRTLYRIADWLAG